MEKHSFEEHRQSLAGKFEKRRTLYTIYFSPTGGTKKVADIVSRALSNERENGGWEMKEIDLSPAGTDYSQYHFTREDICIVAAPSFGGRVPGLVLERLKEMEGGHAKTILAAVYGNRAFEDTLLELEDTLVLAGFDCKAAVAAVAEHSIMHQFGQGRPDAEDEKELAGFAARIRERLEKESGGQEEAAGVLQGEQTGRIPGLPGNRPYREYGGVPFKPEADKSCTGCGLCAKECPAGAILAEKPSSVDKEKCISCMRCISVCPRHARDLNRLVLFAASQKMKKACSGRKKNELFI